MRRFLPHAFCSFVFTLFALIFFCVPERLLRDPDTGWHIATGDWIRGHHALPIHDVFAFTTGDYSWLNVSWLWDVGLSALHSFGGLWWPVVVTIILGALTLALLASLCLQRGAGVIPVFAALLIAALPFALTLNVRPHQVSYLFIILLLIALLRWKRGGLSDAALTMVVVGLMVPWVNLHGGFLVVFTLVGAYGVQALAERNLREVRVLFITGVLCAVVMLLTPYGLHIGEAALRTLGSALAATIQEWQPARMEVSNALFLLYPVAYLALLLIYWRKLSIAEGLLSVFWLVMAMSSIRHLPVFVLVSLPGFATMLAGIMNQVPRLALRNTRMTADLAEQSTRALFLTIAMIISLFMATPMAQTIALKSEASFPAAYYPVEEVEYITQHHGCLRLLNSYNFGGYIIYKTHGTLPVFMDGRAETAYPKDVVQDFMVFHHVSAELPAVLKKHNIEMVLVSHAPDARYTDYFAALPAWKEVFKGKNASVFIRRDRLKKGCFK